MKFSKCKACGEEIVWARSVNGKMIPLERIRNVYTVDWAVSCWAAIPRELVEEAYTPHFDHCRKSEDQPKPDLAKEIDV